MRASFLVIAFLVTVPAWGQEQTELKQILERLQHLEEDNKMLLSEMRALRTELAAARSAQPQPAASVERESGASPEPLPEQVAVQQQRIDEHEQDKVGTDHRLPVQLTGMVLFNAFLNGKNSGTLIDPLTASPTPGSASAGATLRQSVLGLKFQGPQTFWGGRINGSLFMDFFGGSGTPLNDIFRVRVATINFDWPHTSFSAGQDKPILAPREPESLAQIGFSPLTGAGNLWLWAPQARLEQRFLFGEQSGLRAQLGVYQTSEALVTSSYAGGTTGEAAFSSYLALARPALQGRFEFWKQAGENRRIEIAPGFDFSSSHIFGKSLPSHLGSVDWLIRPAAKFDFTGQFFAGTNSGPIGGLHQGITILSPYRVRAVRALGGWAQLQFRLTDRLTFDLYGGQEDDRNRDLLLGAIAKNQAYAANVLYRFGSNVLGSFEYSQVRTTYLGSGTSLNPHYDLGIAYLF